jgi:hypothetical protein
MVGDEAAFASCVTDLVRELRDTHDVKAFTICSLSEHTVDFYVLAALQNNRKGLDLEFVYPEDDADNVVAKLSSVSNDLAPGTLSAVGVAGGWRPAHLRAIQDSDLVIAIGGSDWGTTTVVYSAEVMGVPVVLVPGFGGAASRGWADFRRYYGPSDQIYLCAAPGATHWARDVARATMSILSQNPFNSSRLSSLLWSVAVMLLGVGGWLAAQWDLSRRSPLGGITTNLTVGLAAAALVGHLLSRRAQLGALRLGDQLRGLIIAIGTAFTVLVTSELAVFFLSGKASTFWVDQEESRSLLVRLSILALFAGLIAEDYFDSLIQKGRRYLS